MKQYFVALSLFLSLAVVQGCKPTTQIVSKPHTKYLPAEFQNLYFGMPLADFKTIKKDVKMESDGASFRLIATEKDMNAQVREVTYYFANTNTSVNPLYEIIIEYKDVFYRDQVASKLYGAPNSGDEWRFDSGEGYQIMIWRFETKLVIAAKMKGTEWENE